jgi:hypothetical protein
VPSIEPAAPTDSKSSGTSRCSSVNSGVDDHPGVQNLIVLFGSRMPPASSISSRMVMPSGASYWPGLLDVPGEAEDAEAGGLLGAHRGLNQSGPCRMIPGTEAMDSTLLTDVGRA